MQTFETTLGRVASKCEYEYGFNGAIGFVYMSVKDNLRWNNISVKHYTHILMNIGRFMAMSDEKFKKSSLEHNKMSSDEIASILIAAFGDGK